MSSARAINELSRSKSRYRHQDELLLGFYKLPDSTAKEVSTEIYDWKYETHADSPKRAFDLASDRLGYLEIVGCRTCRWTNQKAKIYRITAKGIEHLQTIGLLSPAQAAVNVSNAFTGKPAGLSAMRSALGV